MAALIEHHLSLVTSRQESQRRESLAALANDLTLRSDGSERAVATVTIVSRIRPCLIDGSKSIREQALRVLKALNPTEIAYNIPSILIYVHIGLVHLAADIRSSSLDVLEWLVQIAPEQTVGCAGGWLKTLTTLVTLLNWQAMEAQDQKGWTSASSKTTGSRGPADGKLKARQVAVLAAILGAGLRTTDMSQGPLTSKGLPLWHQDHHRIGYRPAPFASLAMFGTSIDKDNAIYDDVASRQEALQKGLQRSIHRGMQEAKKEGGEIGRAATMLNKVLTDSMLAHELADT